MTSITLAKIGVSLVTNGTFTVADVKLEFRLQTFGFVLSGTL